MSIENKDFTKQEEIEIMISDVVNFNFDTDVWDELDEMHLKYPDLICVVIDKFHDSRDESVRDWLSFIIRRYENYYPAELYYKLYQTVSEERNISYGYKIEKKEYLDPETREVFEQMKKDRPGENLVFLMFDIIDQLRYGKEIDKSLKEPWYKMCRLGMSAEEVYGKPLSYQTHMQVVEFVVDPNGNPNPWLKVSDGTYSCWVYYPTFKRLKPGNIIPRKFLTISPYGSGVFCELKPSNIEVPYLRPLLDSPTYTAYEFCGQVVDRLQQLISVGGLLFGSSILTAEQKVGDWVCVRGVSFSISSYF